MLTDSCNTLADHDYWKALICIFVVGAILTMIAFRIGFSMGTQDEAIAHIYGEHDTGPEFMLYRDSQLVGYSTRNGDKYVLAVSWRENVTKESQGGFLVLEANHIVYGKVGQ